MKKLLLFILILPLIGFGQTKIRNTQLTSGNQPSGKVLKSDGATNVIWGDDNGGTGHDSITIAPGSTGYFEVNYPQIFSGQKLIDSLGVINTKIAGKEPTLTKGNLTAGSSKVNIGGTGTGAVIGAGASIDVNEANIVHQNISGHGTNTHAQIDTHITNDLDLSSTNEIQDLSLSGNTLALSGDASTVDLSGYASAFSGTANYIPKFGLSGTTLENSGLLWDNNLLKITVGTNKYITIDTESSSGLPTDGVVLGFSRSSDGIKGLFELTTYNGDFLMRSRSAYRFYTNNSEKAAIIESGNLGIGYASGTEIDNHKLAVNGNVFLNGFTNASSYKLSGVDLFSSLSANTLEKWDGTKHTSISNASGYLYNDGTGNMIWIKTVPQSLSGTTPTLNASNGVNANISISGATTLTLSNLVSGTSGTIYLTNNASVYRIKIAGYTIAPASNITYDSTGILLPASSVSTHSSIGWYYNGTTVQIHKADYNLTTH